MSNVLKVLQYIYNGTGDYQGGLKGGVRRLDNLTNTWQLVAPFDEASTIMASALLASGDITSDLVFLAKDTDGTQLYGADVVDPTDPNYQDYTDWLVWEGQIGDLSLQKISKYRAGTIQVNFNVFDLEDGTELVTEIGTFGNASSTTGGDLPDPLTYAGSDGDYYRLNIPSYVSTNGDGQEYLYNEAAYWDTDEWILGSSERLNLNTAVKITSVGPAVTANVNSLDADDPLTTQITDKLNDHESRITVLEDLAFGVDDSFMLKSDFATEASASLDVKYARNMRTSLGVDESTALEVATVVSRVDQDLKIASTPSFRGYHIYDSTGTEFAVVDFANGDFRVTYNGITKEYGKNLFVGIKARTIIGEGVVIQYDGAVGGGSDKIWAKIADKAEINVAPYLILGVTTTPLTANEEQDINYYGAINEIDTTNYDGNSGTGADEGQILYYDSINGNGGMTLTEPEAPNVQIKMAVISSYHATNGQIKVRPDVGSFLGDLHDVYLNGGVNDGDVIKYNLSTERWEIYALDTALEARRFVKTGWDLDVQALVSISFVNATRTFTVAKTSAVVPYWLSNVEYELDADKTVVIDDIEGLWFIYINPSNVLVASQTAWDLRADNAVPVSVVNWDATNKVAVAVAYELHSWRMSGVDHFDSHFGLGTLHISGGGLSDNGSDQLDLTALVLADEDINISVVDDDTPTAYFEQPLTPLKSYKYYRDGANGDLRRADDSTTPFLVVGNKVQLNPFTGGVWTLTDMTVNKFGAYWNIWTTDISNSAKQFLGQEEADSLNNAIEANTLSSLDLGTIPFQEIKVAYRIIVQQINTAPYYVIEQIDNMLVDPVTGIPTLAPTSHGALSGLLDDDHPQYHTDARAKIYGDAEWVEQDLTAYTEDLTVTGAMKVYIEDTTTPKRTTIDAIATYIGSLSGSVINTGKYYDSGLGSHDTALVKIFTMLNSANADVYADIIDTTIITDFYTSSGIDKLIKIKMPSSLTDDTQNARLSIDNGVTYDDILVNGATVNGSVLLDKTLELKYTLNGWTVDLQSLSQQLTFDSAINSTYDTVAPINGSPEFNKAYGLSLNTAVYEQDVIDTGTINFDSISGINYYDWLNGVIITGTGSNIVVTNATGATADMMVVVISNTPIASKTASQLANIIPTYFEGYTYITNFELWSRGLQLFNVLDYDVDTTHSYKIRVKPSQDYKWVESVEYKLYDIGENLLSTATSTTVTTTSDTAYISFINTISTPSGFMLNEGTTAEDWQAYNSPQDNFKLITNLLSVGSIRDEAYYLNGIWVKDKYVGRDYNDAVQGMSSWSLLTTQTNTISFYNSITSLGLDIALIASNGDLANIFIKIGDTTYPTIIRSGQDTTDSISLSQTTTNDLIIINFLKTDLGSLDSAGVVAYLQANNVEFVYELDTMTQTEIEKDGSLIQESNTTLVQVNNFATEYDITFNLDSTAQRQLDTMKIIYLQGEVDDLEIEDARLDTEQIAQGVRITDTEDDIGDVSTLPTTSKEVVGAITELHTEVELNNVKITYPSADSTKVGYLTVSEAVNLNKVAEYTEIYSGTLNVPTDTSLPSSNITLSESFGNFDVHEIHIDYNSLGRVHVERFILSIGDTHNGLYPFSITTSGEANARFKLYGLNQTSLTAYYGSLITTTYGDDTSIEIARATDSLIQIVKIVGIKYS